MAVLPNPDYLNHPRFRAAAERIKANTSAVALGQFLPAFQQSYLDWMKADRPDYSTRIGAGDEILSVLQKQGVSLWCIGGRAKAELVANCQPFVDILEAKLAAFQGKPKFRDMNIALPRAEYGEIYDLISRIFGDSHVFDAAQTYAKRSLRIKKLYVQLNTEEETAVRYGPLDSAGLPSLKTDYWHIDSDIWPNVKVLIYLNEVGLDQGPLRYVIGSHRRVPAFETVVRKTNDTLKLPAEQFLALPDEFRMHALFGPFLTGEELGVAGLLDEELALCGDGADLVLFDNNGVHRGGFVRKGSRPIVQCLFEGA